MPTITRTKRKSFFPPRIYDRVYDFKAQIPKILKARKLNKRRETKEAYDNYLDSINSPPLSQIELNDLKESEKELESGEYKIFNTVEEFLCELESYE